MYLITGIAGFIGFHVASSLLREGKPVLGLDMPGINGDARIKQARLDALARTHPHFTFAPCDITEQTQLTASIKPHAAKITHMLHLAAQTGVRQGMKTPQIYVRSNIAGQLAMLEQYRMLPSAEHFVYASSSSVYGAASTLPFKESHRTDQPLSLYAATKKAAETITESYAHLYRIPATGLRLFTVHGPWGRPDMAYFSFARKILAGQSIQLFNHGHMRRDFTYIDDIIAGILAILPRPPSGDSTHVIYNLGSGRSETVESLLGYLEEMLGKPAIREYLPPQVEEMGETCADITAARQHFGFTPRVDLREGIHRFVQWYKDFPDEG